ncbi:MAG: hypothetical protein JWQ90_1500 [Hydrocarboniphaga sp.]|uniref:hypothetical protein n=1 Tax=Hydrocarboniphaga sp. TaxID=2033016 RepID=UPI0026142D79|nr:hypothetical protein [Hydrocarboniphaga sp.]MDB5969050.1 hypothetical protein [Hydrocarboniphaga sp.]
MNSMTTTSHAKARQRQRGINDLQIALLHAFGEPTYQKGGGCTVRIREQLRLELRGALDKMQDVALVEGSFGKVVTVLHEDRRSKRMYRVK